MEDGYWDLFWNTGLPEAYLLRKRKDREPPGGFGGVQDFPQKRRPDAEAPGGAADRDRRRTSVQRPVPLARGAKVAGPGQLPFYERQQDEAPVRLAVCPEDFPLPLHCGGDLPRLQHQIGGLSGDGPHELQQSFRVGLLRPADEAGFPVFQCDSFAFIFHNVFSASPLQALRHQEEVRIGAILIP